MKAYKYLIVPWTAVAVYGFLSMFLGAMGFSAYRQLEAERDKQSANMEKLMLINDELEDTKNSLLYDHDTLSVYARSLGYSQKGERFLRIVGLGGLKSTQNDPGKLVAVVPPRHVTDTVIKLGALTAAALVFALLLLYDILTIKNREIPRKRRPETPQGSP